MKIMVLKLALAVGLLGSAAAASAQPNARQATGQWTVDFDDAQCVASRSYGTAKDRLFLALKAPPLGDVMQISVLRQGAYGDADQVDATISLDAQPPLKTNMLRYAPVGSKMRVYQLNMPSAEFSKVRGAKALSIKSSGLNETFALSQIEPLLKIMNDCVADLRKVWNVTDPEGQQSQLAQRASGNVLRFFKDEDYPDRALSNDLSGTAQFVALVDESGKVADCTIIQTSGIAVLDAQTCVIMRQRAKFEAARGQDGKPAKDALINRVRWVTTR